MIPYDQISDMILWVLCQKGLTTTQIEEQKKTRYTGPIIDKGAPVWHHKSSVYVAVAKELKLDPILWDENRSTDLFQRAITFEVRKLCRSKKIIEWKVSGRLILRLDAPKEKIQRPAISIAETSHLYNEPEIHTEVQMANMFMSILRNGRKDNTYKFALARAILEYCNDDTNVDMHSRNEISYDYFADKFLEYYWHQECKFKMKQSSHVERTPSVVKAIRDSFGAKNIPEDFKHTKVEDRIKAKNMILRGVFGTIQSRTSNVVPKFQHITSKRAYEKKVFYDYDNEEKKIFLKKGAFEFFKKYNGVLSGLVLAEWAKFLEKRNGGLPQLVAKIEARDPKRSALTGMRKELNKYQKHCFYCNNTLEKGWIDVDHHIPWSYIFNDDEWNLVLACRACNCKKSNALAQEEFTDELIKRNSTYYGTISGLKRSIEMIDIRKGWQNEIHNYYSSCIEYGFEKIRLP